MGRTAVLFPGQGAQSVGMGRALADSHPEARRLFDRASEVLSFDLARVCFEGPREALDATDVSQPAIFVCSLAAVEALRREAPDPLEQAGATAGLSLGEYTSLVFAGAIGFEDGLRLVQARGAAMQAASAATESAMVSVVGLPREKVDSICRRVLDEPEHAGRVLAVANLLAPDVFALSGETAPLRRAEELALAAGAMKCTRLPVAGAFHTPLMQPAVARLTDAVQRTPIDRPRIAVVFNVDARPHFDAEEIRKLLIRQVVSPVLWEESMRRLLADGCDGFYEVGPGRVLRGLLRRIDRRAECRGFEA